MHVHDYPTQILANWRSKRIIDPQTVDEIVLKLNDRRASIHVSEDSSSLSKEYSREPSYALSRNEIVKRIEEDRERHKRLRERRWVQPISHNPLPQQLPQLASFMPDPNGLGIKGTELTIDIEFDNEWETTSDWNEDDEEAANEENDLCFPNLHGRGGQPIDVSR